MSGAVAAHAAYNGAGTQGLAVTNKINDTGDVTSVFWTKNDTTRQLLHGSSLVEVVSSGTSGQTNTFGSSKIFTINNDVDVLGDLYLDLGLTITPTFLVNTKPRTLMDYELDEGFQFKLIDRVEFMVGTQIWHTLTGADIKVLTKTLKPEGNNDVLCTGIKSERFRRGARSEDTVFTAADPADFEADVSSADLGILSGQSETARVVLWIPALSSELSSPLRKFYNISENGYVMAAAPQQSVKIKVTFKNNTNTSKLSTRFLETFSTTVSGEAIINTYAQATTAGTQVLTRSGSNIFEETNALYPFYHVVTGFATGATGATVATDASNVTIDIAISSVRMFAKQIMLCTEERAQIRSVPNGLPFRIKMTQSIRAEVSSTERTIDLDSFSLYASHIIITGDISNSFITEAELKLNSSSFSGSLPAILLKNNTAESLKLYSGKVLGSRVLGGPHLSGVSPVLRPGIGREEQPILVFPLASTAFSGSGVPLNRFDSIRLTLKFGTTSPTGSTLLLASAGINVTCVGETTVLYKGGAATLAMY
jgi:hypothetical protein